MDDELLRILRCPISKKPLRRLTPLEILKLNLQIRKGRVECPDEHKPEPLSDGLITVDNKRIYPIRNGVVVTQQWESIETNQLTDFPSSE